MLAVVCISVSPCLEEIVVTDENKNVIISVTRDYRMGQRKSVPQPPPQPPPQPQPPS